jgi:diaminopimelate decarboxylase
MFKENIISKFKGTPTPFYYYDLDVLTRTLQKVKEESSKYNFIVHYALKANANNEILQIIRDHGMGADCVSGNEVKKAVEMKFDNKHIVFAGVGKSDDEINYALDQDIFCFNCESKEELEIIDGLAKAKNKTANIALRINPNVNANTHKYITTGLEENKFGINLWELEDVAKLLDGLHNIKLIGLHFHIGSQITDMSSFKSLCLRVNEIQGWFVSHKIHIENVNVGGGLGVDYHDPNNHMIPDFETYFKLFNDFLELRPGQKVHFELGRAIVAQCGTLVSRVLYIKKGVNTNFAILDAGMTELMRPALYQAYHKIENISKMFDGKDKMENGTSSLKKYDVVGPICESSDCFGKAVDLPETSRGDLVVLRTAGAYGEVMANGYNLRDKVKAVYSE